MNTNGHGYEGKEKFRVGTLRRREGARGWAGFGHGKGVAVLWFSCTDSRWAGLLGRGGGRRRQPTLSKAVQSLRFNV